MTCNPWPIVGGERREWLVSVKLRRPGPRWEHPVWSDNNNILFYYFFYEFVGQVGLSLPFPCPKADRHVDSRLCSGILPWHLSLCSRMHFHAHTRNPVGIASSFSTFPVSIAVWPALVATEIDIIIIIIITFLPIPTVAIRSYDLSTIPERARTRDLTLLLRTNYY